MKIENPKMLRVTLHYEGVFTEYNLFIRDPETGAAFPSLKKAREDAEFDADILRDPRALKHVLQARVRRRRTVEQRFLQLADNFINTIEINEEWPDRKETKEETDE